MARPTAKGYCFNKRLNKYLESANRASAAVSEENK